MGSQQIILIILGVIIIGVAVVLGINMFNRQALNAHRQEIVSEMGNMMVEAIAYKKMPLSLGGGSGTFRGYMPAGAESYRGHIGSPANTGVRVITPTVNYFIEYWAEGAYRQRVKIIASSKVYGEGNHWSNTYNARIIASFDKEGKVIYSSNPNMNGYQITGDWRK
jgi:hypothetical protein